MPMTRGKYMDQWDMVGSLSCIDRHLEYPDYENTRYPRTYREDEPDFMDRRHVSARGYSQRPREGRSENISNSRPTSGPCNSRSSHEAPVDYSRAPSPNDEVRYEPKYDESKTVAYHGRGARDHRTSHGSNKTLIHDDGKDGHTRWYGTRPDSRSQGPPSDQRDFYRGRDDYHDNRAYNYDVRTHSDNGQRHDQNSQASGYGDHGYVDASKRGDDYAYDIHGYGHGDPISILEVDGGEPGWYKSDNGPDENEGPNCYEDYHCEDDGDGYNDYFGEDDDNDCWDGDDDDYYYDDDDD